MRLYLHFFCAYLNLDKRNAIIFKWKNPFKKKHTYLKSSKISPTVMAITSQVTVKKKLFHVYY